MAKLETTKEVKGATYLLTRTTFVLVTCLAMVAGCEISMNQAMRDRDERVNSFLDEHTSKSRIPGIQYMIVDSDQIIFQYTGGWADIKNRRPMKAGTTMMAYSMTKTITAAAILQLAERGKLSLEDSVDMYLSGNPYGNAITIRHLLSQTSGIPNPIPLRWAHTAEKHETFDEDAALAKALQKNLKPSFEAGRKYGYSNISYWYLGKIIEKVSGQSYTAYMRENILNPLQVSEEELGYSIPNPGNHAKGYLAKYSFMNLLKRFLLDKELIGDYEGRWLHINSHHLNGPSFGGLVGTADSFRHFLQDQLKNESVLFGNTTRNLFYAQQKNNDGKLVVMTLGWHVGNVEGTGYFFKEGGGGGYHSEMRIYPAQKVASLIMVNKTVFNSRKFLNALDKEFLFQSH